VKAGRLRHRLELQRNTPTRNTSGEMSDAWATVGTYWGSISAVKGDERFSSAQRVADADITIMMRHVGTITTADRLVHRAKTYDIREVIDRDERNAEYTLRCSEGASDG